MGSERKKGKKGGREGWREREGKERATSHHVSQSDYGEILPQASLTWPEMALLTPAGLCSKASLEALAAHVPCTLTSSSENCLTHHSLSLGCLPSISRQGS